MSEKVYVDLDKLRERMVAQQSPEADLLFTLVEDLHRQVKTAQDESLRLRHALHEIDTMPVGACETLSGDVEPCDACGEMRTIAENALRGVGTGAELVTRLRAAESRAEKADTERKAWTELGAQEQRRAELAEADAAALRQLIEQYTTAATYDDRATLRARMYDVALGMPTGAALLAEHRRLLVVAYEAYKLSEQIAEFETVVDGHAVEALDRALMRAFGVSEIGDFLMVGGKITEALGGYEAALTARRE